MNSLKAFFKEKGLYLICLALVFAATVVGILAIRSVVNNVSDLTKSKQQAIEEGNKAWDAPDAIVNNPVTDLPEETPNPAQDAAATPQQDAASSSGSSASSPSSGASSQPAAVSGEAGGSSASSAPSATLPTTPVAGEAGKAFSGDELVYSATLGDWRTHNGADYQSAAGTPVYAVKAGEVAAVYEDALWGGVVEVSTADGVLWRYCGVDAAAVKAGQSIAAGAKLGALATPPAESEDGDHLHVECSKDGAYIDPATLR